MANPVDINYPLLRIYTYYRLGLSSLLLLMYSARLAPNILGSHEPPLFLFTALAYTLINLLTLAILWRREFSPSNEQLFVILFIDIVALILLLHASGGLGSGLGFLILITTATGGICLKTQAGSALAATATLLVLAESLYMIQQGEGDTRNLFAAGTLGTMLFATALLFNYLSKRLHSSTAEARSQAEQAAHLQRLAQLIVERMQTGIVVAQPSGRIALINHAAISLLNCPDGQPPQQLCDIPELEEHIGLWKQHTQARAPILNTRDDHSEVRLRFADLATASDQNSDTLVFVEDTRSLNREAQRIKLASLGRLTASIAHEIRNPLGAISHAGQLLAESDKLDPADRRLTEIIDTNARRVNQIIENVLQLSRRRPTRPERLELGPWLQQFVEDCHSSYAGGARIDLQLPADRIHTRIDASHLNQVMTNLVDNGLRHSQQAIGEAHLTIKLGIDTISELPYLLVIDDGEGIPEDSLLHIFEPFYTTQASGSGLGLYLSRELCEANHATLTYRRDDHNKSCFRILFSHPDRMF